MNENYILMHKDTPCALIAIDGDSGALTEYEAIHEAYTPFLGNADEQLMKKWWEHRAVPGSRKAMEAIIQEAGCENSKGYLAKNLALSMTDTYWICPVELPLSWQDVNLYRNRKTSADVVALHNASSYDPNASLGGEMDKYWDISGNEPILIKKAYQSFGQQSINELFASEVHHRQHSGIPFVGYAVETTEDHAVLSRCKAFTSQQIEFIPAYEILHSHKRRGSRTSFDQFMDACEKHGLDRNEMQKFMDYLILSDFAISNADEHFLNFGVLRDTDTMELIGPAPIFDSGNSMFFDVLRDQPLQRKELLERKINSFHGQEEKMLSHVRNRETVDADALPSCEEVEAFYESYGLPHERATFIAESYDNKLMLLRDFQAGRSISLYHEQHFPGA